MSDERRDDEIIGRALSRAIETIDLNQTPFERSRIATAPARRSIFGLWQIATAAAAIVLALAIGSWLTRPTEGQPGVAASPTASVGSSPSPVAATPSPAATPTPAPTRPDHQIVYFARDGLPPVAAHDDQGMPDGGSVDVKRVTARIADLLGRRVTPPAGAFTAIPANLAVKAATVEIQGDLVKADFTVTGSDWGIRGAAQSTAFLQQLVYTATEEPGIRRVLVTVNGGKTATIDQLVVDRPLSREDVFGYSFRGTVGKANGISWGGNDSLTHVGARLAGYDIQNGTRAALFLEGRDASGQTAELPSFNVWLEQSDDTTPIGAKYTLYVEFQWNGGGNSNGAADVRIFDQSPLRAVTTNGNNIFRIELDDARPWRVSYVSKSDVTIEIGGDPRTTSDRIAVTSPKPGDVANSGAALRLTGSARVFEANVTWRLLDAASKEVASGHFNASLGSSAVWGTFDTRITLPANVRGNLTLELFESSPKDGSAQGVVQIPLAVR
jgi:Immunoglobulin-like domain of bacterial spore germination/Sporulation and spore germination